MNKMIPLAAAALAARYQALGLGRVFETANYALVEVASSAAGVCIEQDRLTDEELLRIDWEREDAEKALGDLLDDFIDAKLMIVSPTADELWQIKLDRIELSKERLDLLLAALDHTRKSAEANDSIKHLAFSLGLLAHQLRIGAVVIIATA